MKKGLLLLPIIDNVIHHLVAVSNSTSRTVVKFFSVHKTIIRHTHGKEEYQMPTTIYLSCTLTNFLQNYPPYSKSPLYPVLTRSRVLLRC